jgi:hypothetical protein
MSVTLLRERERESERESEREEREMRLKTTPAYIYSIQTLAYIPNI